MGKRRRRALPAEVKRVREGIEHWRRTREKRGRMPEPLWDAAVGLAQAHGVHWMSDALHVSYDSLKARVTRAAKSNEGGSRQACEVSFVELAAPPAFGAAHTSGTVVEVEERNGAKLTIRLAAGVDLEVAAVMSAFRRGQR